MNQLLQEIGLDRNKIFITNTIKCRPPNNKIEDRYVECCADILGIELRKCNPKVVVTLGAVASKWIQQRTQCEGLGTRTGISMIQGNVYEIHTIIGTMIWIPVYHPAAALRDPGKVEDMKKCFGLLQDILKQLDILP